MSAPLLFALVAPVHASEPVEEVRYDTVRESYGASVQGTAICPNGVGPAFEARGGGALTRRLTMGGGGGGVQCSGPFIPYSYGGSYLELVVLPDRRLSPVAELHVNVGVAVAGGVHVFFAPRAALRLEYMPVPWLAIGAGPSFRGAVPIYVGDGLPVPARDLNGLNLELAVKLAPKWLKQARGVPPEEAGLR